MEIQDFLVSEKRRLEPARWVPDPAGSPDGGIEIHLTPLLERSHPHTLWVKFGNLSRDVERSLEKMGLLGEMVGSQKSLTFSACDDMEDQDRQRGPEESLYRGENGDRVVKVERSGKKKTVSVTWFCRTPESRDRIVEAISKTDFNDRKGEREDIPIELWCKGSYGHPEQIERKLEPLSWEAIRENYPGGVRERMDSLVSLKPERLTGRLLLLTGLPGTGKSHFIHALATSWRSWCKTSIVWSPATFLAEEQSVFSLLSSVAEDEEDASRRWTLIVLEDVGDLLGVDGQMSPGFSTLLNSSDGFIGRGLRVLFLLTANEPVSRIHEAIRRPGRLHAHIDIGRLSEEECLAWGRAHGFSKIVSGPLTLAELYGIESGADVTSARGRAGFV